MHENGTKETKIAERCNGCCCSCFKVERLVALNKNLHKALRQKPNKISNNIYINKIHHDDEQEDRDRINNSIVSKVNNMHKDIQNIYAIASSNLSYLYIFDYLINFAISVSRS